MSTADTPETTPNVTETLDLNPQYNLEDPIYLIFNVPAKPEPKTLRLDLWEAKQLLESAWEQAGFVLPPEDQQQASPKAKLSSEEVYTWSKACIDLLQKRYDVELSFSQIQLFIRTVHEVWESCKKKD